MNKQLTEELLAFEADHLWVNKNLKILLEQYADQWIAVKHGQVVANDPDLTGFYSPGCQTLLIPALNSLPESPWR